MADNETSPTEFQLDVSVNFEAKDIVGGLEPLAVLDLIEEIDAELDWEATVLLSRYFARAAATAPEELLNATDEALEAVLDKEQN